MSKYKAIIFNTQVDLDNERFTPECLEQIARGELPVVGNFESANKIGRAYNLEFDGKNIMCSIDIANILDNVVPTCRFISVSSHFENDI